jgi:hypothetical protein
VGGGLTCRRKREGGEGRGDSEGRGEGGRERRGGECGRNGGEGTAPRARAVNRRRAVSACIRGGSTTTHTPEALYTGAQTCTANPAEGPGWEQAPALDCPRVLHGPISTRIGRRTARADRAGPAVTGASSAGAATLAPSAGATPAAMRHPPRP